MLEPVMIGGHADEYTRKTGQRCVARGVPTGFIECDGAGKAGKEYDQAPSCESGTGMCASQNEPVNSGEHPLQLCGA